MISDCFALSNYPTALLSRDRSPLQVRHASVGRGENRTVTPFTLGRNQSEGTWMQAVADHLFVPAACSTQAAATCSLGSATFSFVLRDAASSHYGGNISAQVCTGMGGCSLL